MQARTKVSGRSGCCRQGDQEADKTRDTESEAASAAEEGIESDRTRRMLRQIEVADRTRDTESEHNTSVTTRVSQSDRQVLRDLLGSDYESPDSQGNMPDSPGAHAERRPQKRHLHSLLGYPPSNAPIPPGISLQQRVRQYPNHLQGENLDPFLGAWTARQIVGALPHHIRTRTQATARDLSFLMSRLRQRFRRLLHKDRNRGWGLVITNRQREGILLDKPLPQNYRDPDHPQNDKIPTEYLGQYQNRLVAPTQPLIMASSRNVTDKTENGDEQQPEHTDPSLGRFVEEKRASGIARVRDWLDENLSASDDVVAEVTDAQSLSSVPQTPLTRDIKPQPPPPNIESSPMARQGTFQKVYDAFDNDPATRHLIPAVYYRSQSRSRRRSRAPSPEIPIPQRQHGTASTDIPRGPGGHPSGQIASPLARERRSRSPRVQPSLSGNEAYRVRPVQVNSDEGRHPYGLASMSCGIRLTGN